MPTISRSVFEDLVVVADVHHGGDGVLRRVIKRGDVPLYHPQISARSTAARTHAAGPSALRSMKTGNTPSVLWSWSRIRGDGVLRRVIKRGDVPLYHPQKAQGQSLHAVDLRMVHHADYFQVNSASAGFGSPTQALPEEIIAEVAALDGVTENGGRASMP